MPLIELRIENKSSIEICFDLSRSIDLHKISTGKTKETAIDGVTSGLIGYDEFVTWEATHFGIRQKLTTHITAYDRPFHFCDEQVKGLFKKLKHDHLFVATRDAIIMTDKFWFESPLGILGKLADKLVLTDYLRRFLQKRNATIKEFAESNKWQQLLS